MTSTHLYFKLKWSLIFVLLAGCLSAQELRMGVRAGINLGQLSEMEVSEGISTEYLQGVYVGVLLEKEISYRLSILPEIAFVQKGYQIAGLDEDINIRGESKSTFNYVTFGSLLKYKITEGPVQWYLSGGGYIGIALVGVNRLTFYPTSGATSATTTIEFGRREKRRVDFEAYLGTGLEFPINEWAIIFDLGYGWGLLDIEERNDNLHPQHRSIRGTLGVLWYLD